jgi:Txe/YoeB family toxin of Txe-Axe toxin-antitoxin module
MDILTLSKKVKLKIAKHSLQKKFNKQIELLKFDPKHPSLNIELLEPKEYGVYSFRIDQKYRGIFIFRKDKEMIEIITVTVHYK